jgi:hypothetical protein
MQISCKAGRIVEKKKKKTIVIPFSMRRVNDHRKGREREREEKNRPMNKDESKFKRSEKSM